MQPMSAQGHDNNSKEKCHPGDQLNKESTSYLIANERRSHPVLLGPSVGTPWNRVTVSGRISSPSGLMDRS